MSSFIAHSLIGFTVGAQKEQPSLKHTLIASLFFIVLASTPDLDYIVNWLRGYQMPVRYSHSIGFVFVIGLLSLLFRNAVLRKSLHRIPVYLFFLAPATHLILDGLVAVHGNPYLFPFTDAMLTFPIGILPSSGYVNVFNYYLWRNLSIELLILIPVVIALTPKLRQLAFKSKWLKTLLALLFVVGLLIGWNLQR